jgi:hypothetical protein
MIRKLVLGASALVLTVGGLAVVAGPAGAAAKPQHQGTLTCVTNTVTTFSPSLVFTIPDKAPATAKKPAKPGKDKKVKILSTTTLSNCVASGDAAGLPAITGGTVVTKSSSPSRLVTNAGNVSGGKTKATLSDLSKFKEDGLGSTTTYLDNGTPNVHGDDIVLPTDTAAIFTLISEGHGSDGLYLVGTGSHSTGKAYAGEAISSIDHSPGVIDKLVASQSPTGLTSITETGTQTIG